MVEFKKFNLWLGIFLTLSATGWANSWLYPDDIDRLVEQAKLMTDTKYSFGARKINSTDCSHFIQTSFESIGIQLPRASYEQGEDPRFETIPVEMRRKGDLLFFKNTYRRGISHVALVVGKNKIIHASQKKKKVVISKLTPKSKLWKKFAFAKRYRLTYPRASFKPSYYSDFGKLQNNSLKLADSNLSH